MKFTAFFLLLKRLNEEKDSVKEKAETLSGHQREVLVREGRKQFQKLQDLGLSIPVRLA